MKVELDLSNYATKSDIKIATGLDTSNFANKVYLASYLATSLNSLKRKVDILDIGKL